MPTSHISVTSKYSDIHGGYILKGRHNGRCAYVKDTCQGDDEVWIFHESQLCQKRWCFASSLPKRCSLTSYFMGASTMYYFESVGDGVSPEVASWTLEFLDSIKDAQAFASLRADTSDLFVDRHFPHSNQSIGSIAMQIARTTKFSWIPVRHLREGHWKLFDGIEPADLLQGSIGNCWFVAAAASMAEFPNEVRRIFCSSTDLEPSGCYTLRLYDHNQGRISDITVDEFIPCYQRRWWDEHGKPLFAKPNGNEAWVLLLEKGMAKMFGSYSKLDSNNPAVAFRALTGEKNTFMWKKVGGSWNKWKLSESGFHFTETWPSMVSNRYSDDEFFLELAKYDSSNFLMSASLKVVHARERRRGDGLVEGHAYSLLQVVHVEGQSLCCLRNPWGVGTQYKGAWSDRDSMWERFPKVRDRLRPKFVEDGIFWMSWSDFVSRWDTVTYCARSMREGKEAEEHRHSSQVGVADPSLSKRWGERLVRPPPAGSLTFPAKPARASAPSATLPADRPVARPTAGVRLCAHSCGRPAFKKYSTCCTHCRGPHGPHARDCMAKVGVTESVKCAAPDMEPTPSPSPPSDTIVGYGLEFEDFEKLRVLSSVVCTEMTPCARHCGQPAFVRQTTCCSDCQGPEASHAHDCETK